MNQEQDAGSRMFDFSQFFSGLTALDLETWAAPSQPHHIRTVLDPWFPYENKTGKPDDKACIKLFNGWHATYPQYCRCGETVAAPDSSQYDPSKSLQARGAIFGGKNRKLHGYAHLESPIYFGESMEVHAGARIIGPVVLGDRAIVYGTAIIKRSVIGADTVIKDNTVIGYSLVGREVLVGANVVFSDDAKILGKLRQEQPLKEFVFQRETGEILSKDLPVIPRQRFGAIVGDGCIIGDGSILEPGVVLDPGCVVPGRSLLKRGYYKANCF